MRTNKDIIYSTIVELHNLGHIVTRELLREVLPLKKSIIDDNLRSLIDTDETVERVVSGVYKPAANHPVARRIWKCTLECGMVNLNIGDTVISLTPSEARTLGKEFMGDAMQYANIELGHYLSRSTAAQDQRINELEQQVAASSSK